MANRVVVEGTLPKAGLGQVVPPRREISALVKDIYQFSLYVQALQEIYDKPANDVVSYWQISGIHGEPYVEWNGTLNVPRSPTDRGFCVHGTPLFPTWHRPYIVLFEQEVQRIARRIAATYTHDTDRWNIEAAFLRQPYWGWDQIATVVPPPEVISAPMVSIVKPDSPAEVLVPNPFLTYTYPAGANAVFGAPFNAWPRTARYPDGLGISQPAKLQAALQALGPQIVNNTQRLMSITTWDAFALGDGTTSGLESIHDTIHNHTGGPNGNMTFIPVASFDPIFYLHHAQVDRVIALWYSRHRVWTPNAADLLPFRRTQTEYWKSPEIIQTNTVFNYVYLGIPNAVQSESSEAGVADYQSEASSTTELEWSVRVECEKYEVGGSFSLYVFMSKEVPSNHTEWLFHPSFAGTFDVFANPNPEKCANCTAHADQTIKGFIHINKKYLERSKKKTLDPEVVIPYLKEHISWGVIKANGEVADIKKFTTLNVTVICTPLTFSDGAKYPTEGRPKVYPEITRGRVGGHRDDQEN
ncbi:Tyrosinase [Psilocybe cubensis]|uniref:Tyrosinase n=2 Tax=Psilocybe cubensis TaxID=181762 RepID=A0ACB8HA52_PSICU|nr:Tyrosinase [Psilocybe cubensis]KAH9484704.1 Tyrosinase [Psilocybe cubensis]